MYICVSYGTSFISSNMEQTILCLVTRWAAEWDRTVGSQTREPFASPDLPMLSHIDAHLNSADGFHTFPSIFCFSLSDNFHCMSYLPWSVVFNSELGVHVMQSKSKITKNHRTIRWFLFDNMYIPVLVCYLLNSLQIRSPQTSQDIFYVIFTACLHKSWSYILKNIFWCSDGKS